MIDLQNVCHDLFKMMELNKDKIYIYGTGRISGIFSLMFEASGFSVGGYFDSFLPEGCEERKILPLKTLHKFKGENIIIGTTAFEDEILSQLDDRIQGMNRIITASDVISNCKNEFFHYAHQYDIVDNFYGTCYKKNALIVYITYPFRKVDHKRHQSEEQVRVIADLLKEQGYNVDIVDHGDPSIEPPHCYDLVMDIHPRKRNCYDSCMKSEVIKIAYLTGANPAFNNSEEKKRIYETSRRKQYELRCVRDVPEIDKCIESFDAVLAMGNGYILNTWSSFRFKKLYPVKNNGYAFSWKNDLRMKRASAFLYLAGFGAIHKGLGILLDVFCELKECELYVACDLSQEEDVRVCYDTELNLENIHYKGFVDIDSEEFENLIKVCTYAILPSCAEGMAGSVLTCMSAGLIPICSKECGFEDDDVEMLKDCEHDTVKNAVKEYSVKSPEWISEKSDYYKRLTETKYSAAAYRSCMESVFAEVLTHRER